MKKALLGLLVIVSVLVVVLVIVLCKGKDNEN